MEKKNKVTRRHDAIRELIRTTPIEDQQTLVELMKNRYNIETNQSIISRDLRALGVTKSLSRNKMIYELPATDASQEILKLAIVDIVHNESTIIVKTLPGLASFVGDYLDMQSSIEIAGTLAGENTVFVAPISIRRIQEVAGDIARILNFKHEEEHEHEQE